jgi:hypothetical protein
MEFVNWACFVVAHNSTTANMLADIVNGVPFFPYMRWKWHMLEVNKCIVPNWGLYACELGRLNIFEGTMN